MLKRKILIGLISIGILFGAAGCREAKESTNSANTEVVTKTETTKTETTKTGNVAITEASQNNRKMNMKPSGFEFERPKLYEENQMNFDILGTKNDENGLGGFTVSYASQTEVDKIMKAMESQEKMSEENQMEIMNAFFESETLLVQLQVYKKESLETTSIEEFSKLPNNDLMGEQDGYVYYISYNNEDAAKNLKEDDMKLYKDGLAAVTQIKESFKMVPIYNEREELETMGKFPSFKTTDLAENEVSESVFADSKITMINVWSTT